MLIRYVYRNVTSLSSSEAVSDADCDANDDDQCLSIVYVNKIEVLEEELDIASVCSLYLFGSRY